MNTTHLLWFGGPHDGLFNSEPDLPLHLGDYVTCNCHGLAYEAKYFDGNGIWHVELDRKQNVPKTTVVKAER